MSYDGLFSNSYFSWVMYSHRYFHSAKKLEEVVRKAEKIWENEMKKLKLKEGEWKWSKSAGSKKLQKARTDLDCHHVYPYLYYHSLELLLKGLSRIFSIDLKKKNTHFTNDIFNEICDKIQPLPVDVNKIKNMLSQLDQIYWAQRYPYQFGLLTDKDTEGLYIKKDEEKYRTNNIGLIFDQHREIFMEFISHLFIFISAKTIDQENVK